jgi:uncharacterized protein (DUF849 family)
MSQENVAMSAMTPGSRSVLIKACLNGSTTRAQHPAVPMTPEEIARDAARSVAAGAGAIHVHARLPDGSQTLEPSHCDAVVTAIRRACPGIPVGLSTTADAEPDPERRLRQVAGWRVLPDFVSVNFREDGVPELCAALIERGVGIEAGLWTLDDAHRFLAGGLWPQCLRVLVEATEQDPPQAVATASAIDDLLAASGVPLPRLHHGEGMATWSVIRAALRQGRDIRIGLEDTTLAVDGFPARDNPELVAEAVRLRAALAWR